MKFVTLQLYLIFILCLVGCDRGDGKLTLINNSTDTIYFDSPYCGDSILSYPIYIKNGKIDTLYSNMILPKQEHHSIVMDSWEYFINTRCKDSTIRVIFFNNTLIKTAGKDSIMKYQLYSKKFKLKVKDLEKLNWEVEYKGE